MPEGEDLWGECHRGRGLKEDEKWGKAALITGGNNPIIMWLSAFLVVPALILRLLIGGYFCH